MMNTIQDRNGLPDALLDDRRFFKLPTSKNSILPPDWNNPRNWCYIDDIPEDAYFGFAIGNNTNYLFIDGDHVRDPESGKFVPWVKDVFHRLIGKAETYCEVSQSRTGFHMIADLGDLGDNFGPESNGYNQIIIQMDPKEYELLPKEEKAKVPKIEFFYRARGRYIYLTGKHDRLIQVAKDEDAAAIFRELLKIREEFHGKYGKGNIPTVTRNNTFELDDSTRKKVLEALPYISADSRELWVRIGLALYNCGFPFEVWDEWSRFTDKRAGVLCDKYDPEETPRIWNSFRNTPSKWNEGTIFRLAKENGYDSSEDCYRPKENDYRERFFDWKPQKNGPPIPTKVIDVEVCSWICTNYDFFILGDLPYFLDEYNCYQLDDGGVKLKRIIQDQISLVPKYCKDCTITGIYRMILYQDKRKKYDELNHYPVEYVPFQNGFYDPIDNKILPILPEHYVINQIPHSYDPEAAHESRVFDDLLKYQLPEDDARELWLEYCATCFNRDTSGQKWMIIRGRGGTGKSTQLNILGACIGEDNISNETLQGLNERFNATFLFGKLANICADISSEDMKRIDVLKKITGEDRNGVKYERKGKDAFFFTPFAKLVFSANEIPLNRDEKTDAFYRRLLITVMDKKPEKVDHRLQRKLTGEIDGIIHRYMEALQRFYDRGGYYPESKRSNDEVRRLRRAADSVISYLDDELIRDPDASIKRSELYDSYCAYCKHEERLYPVTRRTLFERFRDEGFLEKTVNGVRFFVGVGLPDDGYIVVGERDTPFT